MRQQRKSSGGQHGWLMSACVSLIGVAAASTGYGLAVSGAAGWVAMALLPLIGAVAWAGGRPTSESGGGSVSSAVPRPRTATDDAMGMS